VTRLVLLISLLLALCAPASASTGAGTITIYAASSLIDVFPKIDVKARYSFAGSDTLAFQIRQGAPVDVYAAASPKQPDALYREGLVFKPAVFATNRLVLIVPRSNPAGIRSVFDLKKPGLKLVIGAAGVPIGDYTRQILKNLGLSSVLGNVVSNETDVRNVLAKVALGEADAGFVYVTDVRAAADKLKSIKLPAWAQPKVRYEIVVVRSTSRLTAARAFVKRVLGPKGQAALRRYGFGSRS
jgi:molybdate transport system substrate-binding protein